MKQALRRAAPFVLSAAALNALVVFVVAHWVNLAAALAWLAFTLTCVAGVSVAVALRGTGRLLQPPRTSALTVADEDVRGRLEVLDARTSVALQELSNQVAALTKGTRRT